MTTPLFAHDHRVGWEPTVPTSGWLSGAETPRHAREGSLRVLLGLLMWEMAHVPLPDRAVVLGVDASQLREMLHSDEAIDEEWRARWKAVAEILRNLRGVLKAEGTGQWLRTAIPGLDGRTPLDEFDRGALDRLRVYTGRYRDPSFS